LLCRPLRGLIASKHRDRLHQDDRDGHDLRLDTPVQAFTPSKRGLPINPGNGDMTMMTTSRISSGTRRIC